VRERGHAGGRAGPSAAATSYRVVTVVADDDLASPAAPADVAADLTPHGNGLDPESPIESADGLGVRTAQHDEAAAPVEFPDQLGDAPFVVLAEPCALVARVVVYISHLEGLREIDDRVTVRMDGRTVALDPPGAR